METTYRDYAPETKSLLARLIAAGFVIRACSNDGESKIPYTADESFVDEVMSCDESHLFVTSPKGRKGTIYLVYGNEPGVLVADLSDDSDLDAVCTAHADEWENVEQPIRTRA